MIHIGDYLLTLRLMLWVANEETMYSMHLEEERPSFVDISLTISSANYYNMELSLVKYIKPYNEKDIFV